VVEKAVGRDAEVGDGAHVGPFAALEPGSQVAGGARTGPFYTARSGDEPG
jgi:bifunctional N-acetylglucosamine-1-phosphate-uridyltransferase/glucosamine-1-phosphate-acetyltransferase GlmU-like protein